MQGPPGRHRRGCAWRDERRWTRPAGGRRAARCRRHRSRCSFFLRERPLAAHLRGRLAGIARAAVAAARAPASSAACEPELHGLSGVKADRGPVVGWQGGAHLEIGEHDPGTGRVRGQGASRSRCEQSPAAPPRTGPGDENALTNPPPQARPGPTAAARARPPRRRADGVPPGGGEARRASWAACWLLSGLRLRRLVPLDLVLGDPALVQAGVGLDQLYPRPDRDRLGQGGAFLPGREAGGSGSGRGDAAPALFLAAVVLRRRRDAVSRHSAHAMNPRPDQPPAGRNHHITLRIGLTTFREYSSPGG